MKLDMDMLWKPCFVMFGVMTGAHAGTLLEAQIVGNVQQTFSGSEVSSCGVVIAAVELLQGPPSGRALVFNGSFSIGSISGGLVKGRASEMDAKRLASGKAGWEDAKPLPTSYIWMKAPSAPVTTPIKEVPLQKSDDAGYLIYGSELKSVLGMADAVLGKKPIQVGMKIKGRNFDQALFGVVEMSDAQTDQLRQCLAEWAEGIKKKLGGDQPSDTASGPQ